MLDQHELYEKRKTNVISLANDGHPARPFVPAVRGFLVDCEL
jgi:hypothetical protein